VRDEEVIGEMKQRFEGFRKFCVRKRNAEVCLRFKATGYTSMEAEEYVKKDKILFIIQVS
jgi:hypothetical protein